VRCPVTLPSLGDAGVVMVSLGRGCINVETQSHLESHKREAMFRKTHLTASDSLFVATEAKILPSIGSAWLGQLLPGAEYCHVLQSVYSMSPPALMRPRSGRDAKREEMSSEFSYLVSPIQFSIFINSFS